MTVVRKTTDMDFERQLVKRFFNPRSYFFLCVSEHLRSRRPLDEPGAEEEYTLVAALMDRLVNADDPRDELKKLSSTEPFAEYVRILEDSVERFRTEALPPEKLKAAIENVAVLFLDAALACLEDASCRVNLLAYLGFEPEALAGGSVSPDVAFVGEKALEPEAVEARFEEEAFLAAYFRGNVADEFSKVDQAGNDELKRAKAYLTAFYNVRDLAMIHGEDDIETLSAKMAELLRRELSRGEIKPEVLSLAERVRKFIEDSLAQPEEVDPEQVRVLVGILQDALLGHMPEIVMAVDLEESASAETTFELPGAEEETTPEKTAEEKTSQPAAPDRGDEIKTQSEATAKSSQREPSQRRGVDLPAERESEALSEEPAPKGVPSSPSKQTQEMENQGVQAPEESVPTAEATETGELAPEWGFAEMVGIEDFLDLDAETETSEPAAESLSPEEEREAAYQAEIFAESYAPQGLQEATQASGSEGQKDDFRLPGEDDEELLALIREVRNHSEKLKREESSVQKPESEQEPEKQPTEVPATTRLGYGPHAQEAALYLRVMRSALTALRTNPAKRSALEDLDLAASSLKSILRKLGDAKLWAVPSALSAATTILIENGAPASPDFLDAAEEALALLETGPAPAINGKVSEIVEKLSLSQDAPSLQDGDSGSTEPADNGDLDHTFGRPPFRLRGRRSLKEHRQATGL